MKPIQVVFNFDNKDMAEQFLAYMSDGGGEYQFLDLPEEEWRMNGEGKRRVTDFSYDFKRRIVDVHSELLPKRKDRP